MARYGYKFGDPDLAKRRGPDYRDWQKTDIDNMTLKQSVRLFLEGIGDDPEREGLKDTPKRVAEAWNTCFSGYDEKPEDFVTTFDNPQYDGPVILKNAELYTFCEHHIQPIIGEIDIAYQPQDRIIGLSKLVRISRVYAKRLQVQERMTQQIADALNDILKPEWVIVRYTAEHFCMRIRGVRVKESTTTTRAGHGPYPSDIFQR